MAGRARGAQGHPRRHCLPSAGSREGGHARASGTLAPALRPRFRRGAVCRDRSGVETCARPGGACGRRGRQSAQDAQTAARGDRLLGTDRGRRPGEIGARRGMEMRKSKLTRRQFAVRTAAVSATALAAPFVRTAHAAGKLSLMFWDHWVPGANGASTELVNEWAAKEKVEVAIDYVTSQGFKNLLTIAAEAQARSGHDIVAMPTWWPQDQAKNLEPVDDIMEQLIAQNGAVNDTVKYLGGGDNHWIAVPATIGSQIKGPCSRIDLLKQHAGIDIQAMYPAGSPPKAENWTTDTYLRAAEACHKAGFPFGIGLGQTSDSVDTAGAFFQSFGAELVNAKGDLTVKTDAVKQALDYCKRAAAFYPPDAPAWDDASNNKWLVAGKGALIMNPPSAWAVAKRDAPQVAEQCWTHGFPAGPKGRFAPFLPYFWGVWNFGKNKAAAK